MTAGNVAPLTVGRDRDASATIRGYVFQVAATIQRWLELNTDDVLELERGEDIDRIQGAVNLPIPEQLRVLEQLKDLSGSITLRNADVRGFLANAHDHRRQNPSSKLTFRLLTTARIGQEKPCPLTPPMPAIHRWQEIVASYDHAKDGAALDGIRGLLIEKKPENYPAEEWTAFVGFVQKALPEDLREFMRSVEWHADAPDVATTKAACILAVQRRTGCSAGEAEGVYPALFVHIFELLSTPGLKRLSRADAELVLRRPASPSAQSHFIKIQQFLGLVETRLTQLETGLASVEGDLANVKQAIAQQGISGDMNMVVRPPDGRAPPRVTRCVPRDAVVALIQSSLIAKRVVMLRGEPGLGKTQIAVQVFEHLGGQWIDARGLDERRAGGALNAILESGVSAPLVVVDDLVSTTAGGAFARALLRLVTAPKMPSCLLTSNFPLPSRTKLDLGGDYDLIEAPPFSAQEVERAFLDAKAAGACATAQFVRFAKDLTRGHPQLVRALIDYLRQRGWIIDSAVLMEGFSGAYAAGVRSDGRKILRETVADEETRQLLYRLDLVTGRFARQQVELLAAVDPAIARPAERLAEVEGLWVVAESGGAFTLSPLLAASSELLDSVVAEKAHRALGHSVATRGAISESEATQAMIHLVKAKEFNKAGALFLGVLASLPREYVRQRRTPLLLLWWRSSPLPPQMNQALRFMIRANQVRLLESRGEDSSDLIGETAPLLEAAAGGPLGAEDRNAVVAASLMLGPLRRQQNVQLSQRLLRVGLKVAASGVENAAPALGGAVPSSVGTTFWFSLGAVHSPDDLTAWCDTLAVMPDTFIGSFVDDDARRTAMELMVLVPGRVARTASDAALASLEATLERIEELASERSIDVLAASATVGRMLVAQRRGASAAGLRAIAEASQIDATPERTRLIRGTLGMQLADLGDAAAAAELRGALNAHTDVGASVAFRVRLTLGPLLVSSGAPADACDVLRKAADLAAQQDQFVTSDRIVASGELAMALDAAGDDEAAYRAWAAAARVALLQPPTDDIDKAVFTILGHCISYFVSLRTLQRAPSKTLDGSAFVAPAPGVLARATRNAAAAYRERKTALLPALMAMYAQARKDDNEAQVWAQRTVETAETADPETRGMLAHVATPFLLQQDAFSTAFDAAIASVAATSALRGAADAPKNVDPELIAEYTVLVPAYLRVATMLNGGAPAALAGAVDLYNVLCARASRSGQQLWDHAAQIVAASLRDNASLATVTMLEENAVALDDPPLAVLASLAVAQHVDTHLRQAAMRHVQAIHYCVTTLRFDSVMMSTIVVPYLLSFWRGAVTRARFHFRAPSLLESSLLAAEGAPSQEGTRNVLAALCDSLAVRPAPPLAVWLRNSP